MLTESLVLSVVGGLVGIVLALWAERILLSLVAVAPAAMTGSGGLATALNLTLGIDNRMLAFTTVVCLLAGVLFGLAPAFSASRIPLAGSLTASSARVIGGSRFGPSTLLVVTQIALSLLLLIGAGLFTRTLTNLKGEDLGFDRGARSVGVDGSRADRTSGCGDGRALAHGASPSRRCPALSRRPRRIRPFFAASISNRDIPVS